MIGRLFGGPHRRLERARHRLATGEPVLALDLVERLVRRDDEIGTAARELAETARRTVVDQALERARVAEAEGDLEDAADWLRAAASRVGDSEERARIEARQQELEERVRADRAGRWVESVRSEIDQHSEPVSSDDVFYALVDAFEPAWAERLEQRPESFRTAWLALHDGRAAEAMPALDELVASAPDDPVLRLERARCRLALSSPDGAREDLEAIWEEVGDEPLDRAGTLSVPILWAEAMAELGEAEGLVERLEGQVDPDTAPVALAVAFGSALRVAGRAEEAGLFVARAHRASPRSGELTLLRTELELAAGNRDGAIALLEAAVAPTCGAGCSAPSRHHPSIRRLVALHLDAGHRERARELMAYVLRDRGGEASEEDEVLLAGIASE